MSIRQCRDDDDDDDWPKSTSRKGGKQSEKVKGEYRII